MYFKIISLNDTEYTVKNMINIKFNIELYIIVSNKLCIQFLIAFLFYFNYICLCVYVYCI